MRIIFRILFLTSVGFAHVDYSFQIQPIFDQNCTNCHGSSGGLNLTSYEELMKGGNSGSSVIAGDAPSSLIVQRIEGSVNPRMPKDGQALPDSVINLIKKWINEGAMETVTIIAENPFPFSFEILGNYPNPFNPITKIILNSNRKIDGRAIIVSASGKSIYDFGSVHLMVGRNNFFWNAKDSQGGRLSSGSYIFVFKSSGFVLSHRMTLLK